MIIIFFIDLDPRSNLIIRRRMTNIIANSSEVAFGVVPKEHWEQPEWIDEAKATNERNELALAGVKYGGT